MHTATAILVIGLLAPAQDEQEPTGPPVVPPGATGLTSDGEWLPMNEVQLIVNDEILTQMDILRLLEQVRRNEGITTRRQFAEAEQRILVEQTDRILSAQAGYDLNIDPAIIAKEVEDKLDRAIDLYGIRTISEDLQRNNLSSGDIQSELSDDIYRELWERVETGMAPDVGGRISKDRYVRPGFMRFNYDRLDFDPELLEEIGGKPEKVVLQELLVVTGQGGVETSFRTAQKLAERAAEGADFGDLVERFGANPTNRGMQEPVSLVTLARVFPRISQWVAGREAGSISPPYPVEREERIVAWRVMKLVERQPAIVPLFDSPEVQVRIQDVIRRRQDEFWLHQALNKLYAGAYIWPPEIPKQRPPIPPRLPGDK